MIKTVWQFWVETWQNSKALFFGEAIGTICALASAFMLSFGSGDYLLFIFLSYMISNLLFIYVGYIRESAWMILMMSGFLIINIYGIINILT